MKKWKKFTAVALTLLMAVGMLAGCGTNGDQRSESS